MEGQQSNWENITKMPLKIGIKPVLKGSGEEKNVQKLPKLPEHGTFAEVGTPHEQGVQLPN